MSRYNDKKELAFLTNVKEGISEAVSLDSIPELPVILPTIGLEAALNYKIGEMSDNPEEVVTIGKSIIPLAEIQSDYEEQINYRLSCLPRRIGMANLLFSIYSKNGRSRDNPFNSSHDDHHPLHR